MSLAPAHHFDRPTSAWTNFSYVSFGVSIAAMACGVLWLPLDWWAKAYLAMGTLMLIQSCFTLAKNVRDTHESSKIINRIEEARTEKLLRADHGRE